MGAFLSDRDRDHICTQRVVTIIPVESTGVVYSLSSTRRPYKIYIGRTNNLLERLDQHNRGEGAEGTRHPRDRPWAIGSYICDIEHMNEVERESLEHGWKNLVSDMQQRGINSTYSWIMAGRRIVEVYNASCNDGARHIRFVSHFVTERER